MIRVSLPWPAAELWPNRNKGRHWSVTARARATARRDAEYSTHAAMGLKTIAAPLSVKVTFCPPDRRRRDWDNALAACKAYLDGLSDALDVDDRHFAIAIAWGEPVRFGVVHLDVEPTV